MDLFADSLDTSAKVSPPAEEEAIAAKPIQLLGMEAAEASLAETLYHQRLPSAYLFSGAEGIGKATLAFKLAAALLAPVADKAEQGGLFGDALSALTPDKLRYDASSPVITRMKQGSHPDFMWIQPPYDEKKKRFKKDITVESIRAIGSFMSLTAGEGAWKVVLIDPAEAMNPSSANALLKWLEEPPERSLFILISHAAGKLLPTIRSRCRLLTLQPPDQTHFQQIIADKIELDVAAQLYPFVSGSSGLALKWQETGWLQHWQGWLEMITLPPAQQLAAMLKLAEQIAKDEGFTLTHLQRMLDSLLHRITLCQLQGNTEGIADHPSEAAVFSQLAAAKPHAEWMQLWQHTRHVFEQAAVLYLDKRLVTMNLLRHFLNSDSNNA